MARVYKPYHVNTESCHSWFATLSEAVYDYGQSVAFYAARKGYGDRTITISKGDKIISEQLIIEEKGNSHGSV